MAYPSTISFPALFPEGFHKESPAEGAGVSPKVSVPVTEGWKRTACTSKQPAGGMSCPTPGWRRSCSPIQGCCSRHSQELHSFIVIFFSFPGTENWCLERKVSEGGEWLCYVCQADVFLWAPKHMRLLFLAGGVKFPKTAHKYRPNW